MNIKDLIERYKEASDRLKEAKDFHAQLKAQILSVMPYIPDGQETFDLPGVPKFVVKNPRKMNIDLSKVESFMESYLGDINPIERSFSYKFDMKKYKALDFYPDMKADVDKVVSIVNGSVSIEVL